jgi:TRAP-type transport system small permease protein
MNRLLSAIETIAAVFLLAIALLIGANVLLRNVASIQIPDWFDGARLLLGIAVFWGIAVATYRGGHICVDALWEHVGAVNRRRIDVIAALLTLAFLAPLAWMVWIKVGGTGSQATSDLRLPMMWFFALAAAGATAAAGLAVARMWQRLRTHSEDAEAPHGS